MSQMEEWRTRWLKSDVPAWDLEGPHPLFARLFDDVMKLGQLPHKGRIFVPACGRAHNAAVMSRMGHFVKAQDLVPEAIERSKVLYGDHENLHLEVGDSLKTIEEDKEAYDLVFDRAAMCAMSGETRANYITACKEKIRPGGLFASITFSQTGDDVGGPPFAISTKELYEMFEGDFSLVKMEHSKDGSIDNVIKEEVINIWRKTV